MDGKINSIDKEIWYKKILNFCNRNITVVYISVGILIILGYIFFFSSPYFIGGVDEDNLKFTAIGTTSKDGLGKEFTLENWEYCDAEDKMIVEISIENLVFDNVNDYTYSAKVQEVNSDIKTLQTEVVYKDKNYNVITISGVPDNMALDKISLEYESYSKDNSKEKERYGISFYTNMNKVARVGQIIIKSKDGYDLARIERLIAILESQVKEKEDEVLRLTTRGTDILDTINNYELSKSNATPSEQEEIDLKIQNCEDQYKANDGEITKIEAAIDELESDLSDARGTKNTLEYKISQETTVVPTTVSSSKTNGSRSSSSSSLSKSN